MSTKNRIRRLTTEENAIDYLEDGNLVLDNEPDYDHEDIVLEDDIQDSLADLVSAERLSDEVDIAIEDIFELDRLISSVKSTMKYDSNIVGYQDLPILRYTVEHFDRQYGARSSFTDSALTLENFNTEDPRLGGKIALEAIMETLEKTWDIVKAAIIKVWEFIKSFWTKHLSSLGKLKKKLKKCIRKVKGKGGKPNSGESVKLPKYVQKAFKTENEVNVKGILNMGNRQLSSLSTGNKIVKDLTDALKKAAADLKSKGVEEGWNLWEILFGKSSKFKSSGSEGEKGSIKEGYFIAEENQPITTAWWGGVRIIEGESNKIEFFEDSIKYEVEKDADIVPGEKADLIKSLEIGLEMLDHNEKAAKEFVKDAEDFKRAMKDLSDAIHKVKGDEAEKSSSSSSGVNNDHAEDDNKSDKANESSKDAKSITREFDQVSKMIPKINSKLAHLNVVYCKAAMDFAYTSLKTYK